MNERVTKVGFIGLGRMGKPMAVTFCAPAFPSPFTIRAGAGRRTGRSGRARAITAGSREAVGDRRAAVVDDAQVEDVVTGPTASSPAHVQERSLRFTARSLLNR